MSDGEWEQVLDGFVRIEQAKGVVFDRGVGMGMEQAFQALRSYSLAHNLNLVDLARGGRSHRRGEHDS
jgi:AmiR/NasT family two-component response regulator